MRKHVRVANLRVPTIPPDLKEHGFPHTGLPDNRSVGFPDILDPPVDVDRLVQPKPLLVCPNGNLKVLYRLAPVFFDVLTRRQSFKFN